MAELIRDPADFPALYRSADRSSLAAQSRFLTAFRVRLGSLLLATVFGALTWKADGHLRIGAIGAFIAFGCALGAELYFALGRPERAWYEGRAVAESAKTLAWRYIVRGESFESAVADPDRRLLHELAEILRDVDANDLSVPDDTAQQITPEMRRSRALDFPERKALYLSARIADQQGWYSAKARWNERRANQWGIGTIICEIAGMLAGGAKAFGALDIDLLGILAAAAVTIAAWAQAKQYRNLATAYSVASQELASVATEISTLTDEGQWANVVGQAEEAISREHTLWRASRGL